MCDDLEAAITAQEELGTDATKGALILTKAALKSLKKQGSEMQKMARDFKTHVVESDKKLEILTTDVAEIKEKVDLLATDATKWQLVIQVIKALFGDTRRCVLTTVWIAMIFGAIHFEQILDLLKAAL